MKKRTLVGAWFFIILFLTQTGTRLIAFLYSRNQLSLAHDTDILIGTVVGLLLDLALLIGWIGILRRSPRAWKCLTSITICTTALVFVCSLGLAYTKLPSVWCMPFWYTPFLSIPYGLMGIPALALLLTDRPLEWMKTPA